MTFGALQRAEQRLLIRVEAHRAAASPSVVRAVARFSAVGEYGRIWIVIGLAGAVLDRDERRAWLRALLDLLTAYAIGLVLKNVIRRPRPRSDVPAIGTPTQLSFPSSHATTSFAGATALAPLCDRRTAGALGHCLLPLATAMSASRVYLGVHYPSDVVAGALLGRLVARRGRRR